MPDEISLILDDRQSGSVALLERLITELGKELQGADPGAEAFIGKLISIRKKLSHFAAIENFLASLILQAGKSGDFPGAALHFLREYSLYWQDSAGKIAWNFLRHFNPKGLTILTHSHSQTVISLLKELHSREIHFRVLQTLSTPGEEGRKSYEDLHKQRIDAHLIADNDIKDALTQTELILMGCDALLPGKFLNKTGTRNILEQAKKSNKQTILITESRKEIKRPGWEQELTEQPLFEWVPLKLITKTVSEAN